MGAAGDEVHGVLNSADADPAVAVPMFLAGTDEARTLAADEYLDIDTCSIVTGAGGDSYVFFGLTNSLGTGKTILRGTFAANGGMARSFKRTARAGAKGESLWAFAPAGACDVTFTGRIRKV